MAKGGEFERDVCRDLTKWWTGDAESDVVFWRTAGSGARATTRKKKGKKTTQAHCGDVAALTDDAKPLTALVTLELKRGYNETANLHDYLDPREKSAVPDYSEWISQAKASAEAAGTPFWAIIHRRDFREPFILCPIKLMDKLLSGPTWEYAGPVTICQMRFQIAGGWAYVVAMSLTSFLAAVEKADVLRVYKAWLKRSSSRTAKPTSERSSSSNR